MKGKRILAMIIALSMTCSGFVSYAAEMPEETSESINQIENSGETADENEQIKIEDNSETETDIPAEEIEEIIFNVNSDDISVEVNLKTWFYVEYNGNEDLEVFTDDNQVLEVRLVDSAEVDEAVKENVPSDVKWYELTGKTVGETCIRLRAGDLEKVINVKVVENSSEEDEEEQPEQGGEESPEESGPSDEEPGSDDLPQEEIIEDEANENPSNTNEIDSIQNDMDKLSEQAVSIGWSEEADGIRYYTSEDGQYYTGMTEIEGKLYYFDDSTGYLRTSQWINTDDGKRYFANENGILYRNQFIKFDTTYYYMGSDGSVQNGLIEVDGSLYYSEPSTGIVQMTAGWIDYDGKRYFANESGVLYRNQFIKFGDIYYYMSSDGSMKTGTFNIGSVWYHANSVTGMIKLQSGWIEDNGQKYYAQDGGELYVNQFIKFGTTYYYMGADGSVQIGVINVNGTIYYADPDSGIIQSGGGWIEYNGNKYFAKPDGTLYNNQFIKFGTTYYYMGADGSVQKGIVNVNGVVYYADPQSGIIQEYAGWIEYDGKRYFGKGDGTLYSSQFIKFGTTYYYMGADGSVQKGMLNVNGVVYYADPSTGIITHISGWFEMDGKSYFGKGDGTVYSSQFIKFGTTYYYMGADGSLQKGIVDAGGSLYYADPLSGIVKKTAGWIDYNNNKYFANETGVLYRNQFISFGPTQYYMGADGSVQKGNQYINGHWYYFDEETGVLLRQEGWFVSGSHKYYQKPDGTLATGYTDIDGVRYYFDSNGALASKMGIDVSYYQGNIDWDKVKASGVEFVFIRAGYRGYSNGRLVEDTCFRQNIEGALAAGIEVGVYFFSQAINAEEAREEALFTYNLIKNYNVTFPVAFDAEYANSNRTGRADHISAATRTTVVKTFLSTIQSYGYTPMLYSGQYFMQDELQMSALSEYLVWMPQYNSTLTYTGPYKCWQYSSSGKVDGINGNVDMNVWLN